MPLMYCIFVPVLLSKARLMRSFRRPFAFVTVIQKIILHIVAVAHCPSYVMCYIEDILTFVVIKGEQAESVTCICISLFIAC